MKNVDVSVCGLLMVRMEWKMRRKRSTSRVVNLYDFSRLHRVFCVINMRNPSKPRIGCLWA